MSVQTDSFEIDRSDPRVATTAVEQAPPLQPKVFNDLENFLKSWLSPPGLNDSNQSNGLALGNLSDKNNNKITNGKTKNNNIQFKENQHDSHLKKKTIKFLLDTYTNITLKENFSKIDKNNLAFKNLNQMLNSPEFNREVSAFTLLFCFPSFHSPFF